MDYFINYILSNDISYEFFNNIINIFHISHINLNFSFKLSFINLIVFIN